MDTPRLLITADDFGYAPAYDEGIAEAAAAQTIDGTSVMVLRGPDPGRLAGAELDLGLHLELERESAGRRAGPRERRRSLDAFERQLERFRELFGRDPDYLDGHKHCHAAPGLAATLGRAAAAAGLPVRSVDARHRRTLRYLGARTPDLLLGRLAEDEPALPAELAALLAGDGGSGALWEWMVHPGRAGGPSAYDRGRAQDLALLLELGDRRRWAGRGVARCRYSTAFTPMAGSGPQGERG